MKVYEQESTDPNKKRGKRFGDRRDAWKVRNLDAYSKTVPFLMPDRASSTVYFKDIIDATNLVEYIKRKNEELEKLPENERFITKYTYFQVIMTALTRTLALKPHMNRFISGHRIFQRKKIVHIFVAKKALVEEAIETIVKVAFDRDVCLDDVAYKLNKNIKEAKNEDDETTDFLKLLMKFPRFLVIIFKKLMDVANYFGLYPKGIEYIDPMHGSTFVSNLGSIGLENVPFHHLYDRGTCSIFLCVGKIHKGQIYDKDNGFIEKDILEFSFTIDERISNGFYYIQAINIFKNFITNPELLEDRLKEVPIDE